jgi:hypothetical protein
MEPFCYVCEARGTDAMLEHVWVDGIGDVHMCKDHFDTDAMTQMPWWDTKRAKKS